MQLIKGRGIPKASLNHHHHHKLGLEPLKSCFCAQELEWYLGKVIYSPFSLNPIILLQQSLWALKLTKKALCF